MGFAHRQADNDVENEVNKPKRFSRTYKTAANMSIRATHCNELFSTNYLLISIVWAAQKALFSKKKFQPFFFHSPTGWKTATKERKMDIKTINRGNKNFFNLIQTSFVTNNFLLFPFKGHSALGKLTHIESMKETTFQIFNCVGW